MVMQTNGQYIASGMVKKNSSGILQMKMVGPVCGPHFFFRLKV
jgi:hypothetical protein